ncbi:glycyl radical protein [Pelomyxa schiedti]|nr:glycyl radical protein [Pelomyxa schiedti]
MTTSCCGATDVGTAAATSTYGMMATERVRRLREGSVRAREALSCERASLVTDFYVGCSTQPLADSCVSEFCSLVTTSPVRIRALLFQYLCSHCTIYIGEDELIVGEKGPAPKHCPTYPELCCHSLEDLDCLNSREKVPFHVTTETRQVFAEKVIPFWTGRSIREVIFSKMTPDWIQAYKAGIFTEFMEQRAPGHCVLDNKIYHKGMLNFIEEIDLQLSLLDWLNDPMAHSKSEQLHAMRICATSLITLSTRYSQRALEMAEAIPVSGTPEQVRRKGELEKIATICRKVPAHAPSNLWEALQMYWFCHLGVTTELNTWDSFSPGHLDQHIAGWWTEACSSEEMGETGARELLQCFWIKFNNQPAPPKTGVTAAESMTYTDFAQIGVGGLHNDGSDATTPATHAILDVVEQMRLLQPSASVQVSKRSPDSLLKHAARISRTGFGQPSMFNTDAIVQELVRNGASLADAREGGSSGCVEVSCYGKENCNLTGYLNLPKILEIALNGGLDARTGNMIGVPTGVTLESFHSFADILSSFRTQLKHFVDIKVRGNNVIERLYAENMPAPFLSILVSDCIKKAKDYNSGGARYNNTYIQGVGIGTITDCLSALNHLLFQHDSTASQISAAQLSAALKSNFSGLGGERIRLMLQNHTPKYGNDNDEADSIMCQVFESFVQCVEGRPNTKGGWYHVMMLPTTCHVYFGSVTLASADGRKAGLPLSEGVSPVQGADRNGPTAVLKSVAKMDHIRTGGTLLNMRFTPKVLEGDAALDKLVNLIKTYFKLDGHHIQFNVVDRETLIQAQNHPEQYRDLIVRVAGYSDYFCDLGKSLQDEIISRTAHEAV